jgi:23S rRNA (uracil747-C5)-methyltransferase
MECAHYDAGRCRSCTLLPLPYDRQLADKQRHVEQLLGRPEIEWLPAVASAQEGFRNKAKMVVAGSASAPTLGILHPDGEGVDLRDCGLHTSGLQAALPVLAAFVARADLTPYDVARRRGELKYLLVTESPDGELLVRFVLRPQEPVARLRKHLPRLHEELDRIAVVSVNLQPEHKAILEGEREILLSKRATLRMRVNDLDLHLRPQGFFQTNTAMAAALYQQVREWVGEVDPASVWDLYSGVGGFALHVAAPERQVLGVETSHEAVASAVTSASEARLRVQFLAGDATTFARNHRPAPELVIVNPPRRGIGRELSGWLEGSQVRDVVYSSCNAQSLAKDLASMPSLSPVRGRVLDMFPNTGHYEAVVQLRRR